MPADSTDRAPLMLLDRAGRETQARQAPEQLTVASPLLSVHVQPAVAPLLPVQVQPEAEPQLVEIVLQAQAQLEVNAQVAGIVMQMATGGDPAVPGVYR